MKKYFASALVISSLLNSTFASADKKECTFDFSNEASLGEVAKATSKCTGRNIVLGAKVSTAMKVSVKVENASVEDTLRALVEALGFSGLVLEDDGKILRISLSSNPYSNMYPNWRIWELE